MKPPMDTGHRQGVYTAFGYRAAQSGADGIPFTPGAGGDVHLKYDRPKLVSQSRYFYRNNAIYKGLIDRAVGYIIGHDFSLQMTSQDKDYNNQVEKLWWAEWRRPEIRNLTSGRKTGRMVCRELLLAGDTGAIKTDQRKIQLVESEQIAKSRYGADGIDKNKYGTPTKYHVMSYNAGGNLDPSTRREIDPENFLFITDPDRPSATRGTPACQASFPMLHRINDVCDSEAIAWQLLSRLAVSVSRAGGPSLAWNESKAKNSRGDDEDHQAGDRMSDLGYALMFHCNPGEELKGIDRNIPGKDFTASIRMFLRLLGLPLGMPLELTLLDWTQSNYSQTRAVLWQAYYQNFQDWQDLLADFFYDVLLEWRIGYWIKDGLLTRQPDGLEHNWIKPTFPWLDQLKEAQAYALRMDRSFGTHSMVLQSLNMDRTEVINQRQAEIEDSIARAKDIEARTGVAVPWQIFAGLATPATGTPPSPANEAAPDEDDDTSKKDDKDADDD